MEKLLSDVDVSRSAPVAIFLELEAAARSCMFSVFLVNLNITTFCCFMSQIILHYLEEYDFAADIFQHSMM